MSFLGVLADSLIIISVAYWIYEKTGLKFLLVEKLKSKIRIKDHKANILSEYRIQRYDRLVDEIDGILTRDLEPEFKSLNKLYSKMVLSAPDETLRTFLKETQSRLDSTTRNRIYFQLRKELQPDTALELHEIETKFYDRPRQ